MLEAQTSSRTYGASLEVGPVILSHDHVALGASRSVVEQLLRATAVARTDAERLNDKPSSALEEVSRLREHIEVVRRESLTDSLINLPNRKAVGNELARACASGEPVVEAMVRVDHFKAFDDRGGHALGDQALDFVGVVIARTAQAPRLTARDSGDEIG